MNTDEITILQNLERAASNLPIPNISIKEQVWTRINAECNIIEVDSFRYIAVACAVAAIIALFFSVDILSNIQSTVAWEISDQAVSIF